MTKPQFIHTPEGGELAVLPRADYERLRNTYGIDTMRYWGM